MADMNTLYSRLAAADEASDAAALAALAWQMYGLLATTSASLGALRARFRAYVASPRGNGGRLGAGGPAYADARTVAA